MKNDLSTVLESLKKEKSHLENKREEFLNEKDCLYASRKTAVRDCVKKLLPDLKIDTIKELEEQTPGFTVPKVSHWFFFEKVSPSVSLDSLRIQLTAHLDVAKHVPELWNSRIRSVYDARIENLQDTLIPQKAKEISDIEKRIVAIGKLLKADTSKMDPEIKEKLERAVSEQVKKSQVINKPQKKSYSSNSQNQRQNVSNTSSGPSLLEMWLWYELLTPHSETSQEISRVEEFTGQGGTFGSGGSSASWDERSNNVDQQSTNNSQFSTNETQLAAQEELGSQNFS